MAPRTASLACIVLLAMTGALVSAEAPRKLLEETVAAAAPAAAPHKPTGRAPTQADTPVSVSPTGGFVSPPGMGATAGTAASAAPEPVAVASSKGKGLTAPGDPCPLEGCPIETFSFVDVVIARGKAGVRKAVPDHMTPLLPTAPWSTVSGPGGVGANLYWETSTATTSVPGLSPGFEPDHQVSQVLEAAKGIMVTTENLAPARVPLPASRMVVAPVDDVQVAVESGGGGVGGKANATAAAGDARVRAEGEGVRGGSASSAPPAPSDNKAPAAPAPPTVPFGEFGIQYWGGEMMLDPPTLHHIFLGSGWLPSTADILADFGAGLGGSAWLGVQTSYMNKDGTPLSSQLSFGGTVAVPGPPDACWPGKTALTDVDLAKVVSCLLADGRLPYAPTSIYAVFTPRGMSQGSDATGAFCQNYCGWHSTARDGAGRPFKYVFVGSTLRCTSACAGQADASPNGNIEADGMASILAHEITEASSDPALDAWYDGSGNENADKCAWAYGNVYRPPAPPSVTPPPPVGGGGDGGGGGGGSGGGAPPSSPSSSSSDQPIAPAVSGGVANTKVGARHFLIQLNWANRATDGHCDLR